MTFSESIEAIINLLFQVLVLFPYSALTIRRPLPLQRPLSSIISTSEPSRLRSGVAGGEPAMISDRVYDLCRSSASVSSLLSSDSSLSPGEAWKKLYGGQVVGEKESKRTAKAHRDTASPEDLKRAKECGNWGPTEPSDLFLRIYHDALCNLDSSISSAVVSPPLLGSCGVIPLTVISTIPHIMAHMSNLIVRADKEVFLATNYWVNSVASAYITNAMKELSRRAGERGTKVVMKIIYDRGSPKQIFEPHYVVGEKEYLSKAVNLPKPEEIPNIDLQVMNYHKVMLGTFHCKYMVVDRKNAVLQSNNIQDNDNMEMMIHLEGPIVDSMYDAALISWNKKLDPPLPSHNSPAVDGGLGSFDTKSHDEIFSLSGSINGHNAILHPHKMQERKAYEYEPRDIKQPVATQPQTINGTLVTDRPQPLAGPSTNGSVLHPVTEVNSKEEYPSGIRYGVDQQQQVSSVDKTMMETSQRVFAEDLKTNDNANSTGKGQDQVDGVSSAKVARNGPDLRAQQYLDSGEQSIPESQIEHPYPAEYPLPEHIPDDSHYDVDIAAEVARIQTSVTPKTGDTRGEAVTRQLNHTTNKGFKGSAPECPPHEDMTPYIPHPVHEPFPIAMVCREPYGPPNHHSVYNPQNEAWLSALRNAKKNVFIQTPTLNAEPLIPAILEACERGIDIYCYICLGYNDTGELLPMQGGTNEMIAHQLFTTLSATGKKRLHWFWYVAKDQMVPIVAKKKKRSCHIKVMIVDEHIGIQGNGNQDTQSWYHSQEINVMFDSALVCKGWIDGLRRNQNTHLYGEVSQEDGVWRDEHGNQAEDVIGIDPGKFSWAKGFIGAINRVRGTGGF